MRIELLHMKNFAPLFVALDKTEVTLDYRPNYAKKPYKTINIFVGQMGSCKTFLLGHHQPFATLGNLDVRNTEDMVLEGKKGLKEIVYRNGDDLYEITHIYNPGKTGHSIKSYIKKNGTELNENGNNSTFKEIILTEFGLDQSFLKLFRIGSNVINLPDMSSTERKSFISSMITDTDIYTLLYRKIGEENRAINAQMTILINKLHSISNMTEDEVKSEMETEQVITGDLQAEIDKLTQMVYKYEAEISALRGGMTATDYQTQYNTTLAEKSDMEDEIKQIQEDLDQIKDYPNPQEVQKQITTRHTQIEMRNHQIMALQMRISEDEEKKNRLQDQLAVMGSPDHVDNLRETYDSLMATMRDYEHKLQHFTYEGSMGTIVTLIAEANNLNTLIQDAGQYNEEAVRVILKNRQGALNRAKRELDKAYQERDLIQTEMSNMKASTTYVPTHPMVRPFNCPTEDCPYYKYHPFTEKIQASKTVDKSYLERQNRKNKVDAKIYLYEDYPTIARKLDVIQNLWKRVATTLQGLGCLKEEILPDIICNLMHRNWFDLDKLNRIRELCGIREKYYELMQKVAAMRNDLAQYEITDVHQLQRDLDSITATFNQECKQLEELEDANGTDSKELEKLSDIYMKISNLEASKQRLAQLQNMYAGVCSDVTRIEANLEKIGQLTSALAETKQTMAEKKTEYGVHSRSLNKLYMTLTDIRITKEQYEDSLQRQTLIHDVLDAVSSKKGIPLAYVRVFLADCKDIINDLISDVFDDDIEIVDFDIPEESNEFRIPYLRNGAVIDDIVKSSQGERAIISLALSFALIRQRTFPYNIMLLDEVDGPLHRSARNKFITILFKQLRAIQAEQVFLVSHNNTFDGFNVNVIMTTNELVDETNLTSVMKV